MRKSNLIFAVFFLLILGLQSLNAQEYDPFGEYGVKSHANSTVNMHLLPEGEFEVGRDQWGDIVRVNMLKVKDWSKVPGVKKAWVMKGFEGEEGMAWHPIISEVKDVDGDGKLDIFRCRSEHEGARIERLNYDDGSVVWESKPMAAHHSDYLVCADVDADGNVELIYDHEGCAAEKGPVYIVDPMTGTIENKIDYRGDGLSHAQNMAVGDFDPERPGLEIALCGKMGNLFVWGGDGELLWDRDVPSSLLSKGDWDGDGVEDIACFALGANVDGMFSVWNGSGERLYAISFLPGPSKCTWREGYGGSWSHAMPGGHERVRRQVDLDGNGYADYIMPFGAWHWGSDAILFLMEGSEATSIGKKYSTDLDLESVKKVVNDAAEWYENIAEAQQ